MCGDRNIGWPCETCSTVLLFVPSAGASTDIWSGLRPLVRSFIVPLAHSCSLMWKNMNTSAPVTAAVGVLPSHISFVFHNVSCIPSGVGIRNSSCWSCLSQQTFVHIFWIFLVPKPGETTLLQDELQETKERSKELQATVMAVAMPEPCEESPRHQDTRDTRTKHSRN